MAQLPVLIRLRKEFEALKRELTVELPKELERARAHGDLTENAEWTMARQRQEFLRTRLSNLEARISHLATLDLASIPHGSVGLGSRVEIEDHDGGGREEYEIVVPEEVDGSKNRISLSSPLGRAMLGKGQGDDIEVTSPRGKRFYTLVRLRTIHEAISDEDGESPD